MKNIARNYARALAELTQDDLNIQKSVLSEILFLADAVSNVQCGWKYFNDPAIRKESKIKIVEMLKAKLSSVTVNFLCLLIDNGRFYLLPDIQNELIKFVNKAEGKVIAEVYSASQIDVNTLEDLKTQLETALGHNQKITLESKIEPALIGGLKVKVNDLVYDGSIKGKLENLRRNLNVN